MNPNLKSKIDQIIDQWKEKPFPQKVKALFKWCVARLSHNLWMKLLSFLLAVLLWNYVITSNPKITRKKTMTGLSATISGQSTLASNSLALSEDPSDLLKNISVTLEVPQSSYSKVSAGNVQVSLDLTGVRISGLQDVPLKASTGYGSVLSISPSYVTLEIEAIDQRSVPVNSNIVNSNGKYWYNITRLNPQTLTISGAASAVRQIASACVNVDVSSMTASTVTALPYILLDTSGNEISQSMLSRSSSSVSATVEVYPVKELPVSKDSVVTGTVAEGYCVTDVSIQPETVTVASDADVLENLEELMISQVSVDGLEQSFSVPAPILSLSDFKYISNSEVYVTVTIEPKSKQIASEQIEIGYSGLEAGKTAFASLPAFFTQDELESNLILNFDVTGLGEGVYELPYEIVSPTDTEITSESETAEITIMEAEQ